MRPVFTAEELAELALIDAEIDETPMTQAERDESRRRDYVLRGVNLDKKAESRRAYYEANREKIAEIGAALRRWRKEHGLSQRELGDLCGVGQQAVSFWELGSVPIDFNRIEARCPRIMEAFA